MPQTNWQIIEDKSLADVAVKVEGRDYKELLENVALAFKELMVTGELDNLKWINVEIEAESIEELIMKLVEFWILIKDTKNRLPVTVKIAKIKFPFKDGVKIKTGVIKKDKIKGVDIKALSWHNLKVEKVKGSYQVELVFDV